MSNRLFVRDFGTQTDISKIEDLFWSVGTVRSAVLQDRITSGGTQRVAYVEMSSADEVRDCIVRFHGMKLSGYSLTVTEDKPHVPDPHFRAKRLAVLEAKKTSAKRPQKVKTPITAVALAIK